MESRGLEALHHPRIKLAKVDISAEGKHDIAYMFFDDTKQYTAIENELKAKDNLVSMCDNLAKLVGLKEKDYVELETLITNKLKALKVIVKTLDIRVSMNKSGQCFLEDNHCIYAIPRSTYDLLKRGS